MTEQGELIKRLNLQLASEFIFFLSVKIIFMKLFKISKK